VTEGLADTSLFVARETGRPARVDLLPDRLAVSVITIGELRAGVLAARDLGTRDARMATLINALRLDAIPVDIPIAEAWARLRTALHAAGRQMPANDSWIAATAITHGIPVVSQDDDFDDVPGLAVIHV
jgi:predicted nucleic acid-binding protein